MPLDQAAARRHKNLDGSHEFTPSYQVNLYKHGFIAWLPPLGIPNTITELLNYANCFNSLATPTEKKFGDSSMEFTVVSQSIATN